MICHYIAKIKLYLTFNKQSSLLGKGEQVHNNVFFQLGDYIGYYSMGGERLLAIVYSISWSGVIYIYQSDIL